MSARGAKGRQAESAPAATASAELATPSVWRRLLCLLYEGVLLFGVVMVTGLVYALVAQQKHALVGSDGLKVFLFVVLGLYFIYFWTRTGQTLAMLTWHIQLVGVDGAAVKPARALVRYLLCWLWFLPALAVVHYSGLKSGGAISGALIAGVLAYAGLAWLHPQRQFWHDAVCQTRLLSTPARLAGARKPT